jgi:hypothetical protein
VGIKDRHGGQTRDERASIGDRPFGILWIAERLEVVGKFAGEGAWGEVVCAREG